MAVGGEGGGGCFYLNRQVAKSINHKASGASCLDLLLFFCFFSCSSLQILSFFTY